MAVDIAKRIKPIAAAVALAGVILALVGYRSATADPVVREFHLEVPTYPRGLAPVRMVLMSDMHVQGPDMPPGRLLGIVGRINRLKPDVVLIAGDFIGNSGLGKRYFPEQAAAPLRALNPRLGTYAVLGNNDSNITSRLRPALAADRVRILSNEAVRVGPLALGGVDGRLIHSKPALEQARLSAYRALQSTPGVKILLAHAPDEFATAPSFVSLVLAGHTHCGQILIPFVGELAGGSAYGRRHVCGVTREGGKTLVVSGGLGTSHIPLRFGAPPDVWLISVGPPRRSLNES